MNPDLKQIIIAAQRGDESAFTELYNETINYAYFLADRFLSNQHDVQDILQESYISAFRNIQTFDTEKDIKPWLKAIIRNKCINLHHKRTDVPVDLEALDDLSDDDAFLPGDYLEREDKRKEILSIIDNLPAAQRTAIILFYLEGMSIAEIADITEVSESTVKTNLYHARKKIKALVLEEEKRGNKLYGVLAFPALRQILEAEENVAKVSTSVSESILSEVMGSLSTGAAGSASAAASLGSRFAALSTPVRSIIIGGAALLVIGTAVLIIHYAGGSGGQADMPEVSTVSKSPEELDTVPESPVSEEESLSQPEPEEESGAQNEEGAAAESSEEHSQEALESSAEETVVAESEPEQAPAAVQTGYNRFVYDPGCPDIILYDGIEPGNGGYLPFPRTDYFYGGSYSDSSLTASDYFGLIPDQYWIQQMISGFSFDSMERVLAFFREEYQGTAYTAYSESGGGSACQITCQKGSQYLWINLYVGTMNQQSCVFIDMEVSQIPRGTYYKLEDIERGTPTAYTLEQIQ